MGRDEDEAFLNAAADGDADGVARAIAARANLDYQDAAGFTALHQAARGGYEGIAEQLIAARANLNLQSVYGTTALMEAAISGKDGVVTMLVTARADLDLKSSGRTALDIAKEYGEAGEHDDEDERRARQDCKRCVAVLEAAATITPAQGVNSAKTLAAPADDDLAEREQRRADAELAYLRQAEAMMAAEAAAAMR